MTSTPTRHGIRLPLALAAAAVAALAISVGVFVHSAQPTQILGVAAALYGVAGALSVLLQARQMLVRRASCDVSARFLATYAGGYAIWLLYGLSVESIPLILGDAVGLVCGVVTLAVALELRGSLLRPTSWGHRDDTSAPLPDDQQPRSFNREPPLGPVLEL